MIRQTLDRIMEDALAHLMSHAGSAQSHGLARCAL
jgi:hypothetical protein